MTANCQVCRELIGGYVLDALEPDERELVRRHIESCERCLREHAELVTIPVLLDAADSADAVPLRPPARLEEAVLDRFARERRGAWAPGDGRAGAPAPERPGPRWRPRGRLLGPAAAALACALAAVAVVLALGGGGGGGGGGSDDGAGGRVASEAAAPGTSGAPATGGPTSGDPATGGPTTGAPTTGGPAGTAIAPVYRVAMAGSGPAPQASGEARLYPGQTGTGVHLRVSGLKPGAYDYELWCVRDDGWKISAGTFRTDTAGNVDVRLTTAAKPTEYDTLAVQAHRRAPGAGSSGPRVLVGRIRS